MSISLVAQVGESQFKKVKLNSIPLPKAPAQLLISDVEFLDSKESNNLALDAVHKIVNTEFESNIASYYGSIKKSSPDQWGRIYSYSIVDTGFFQKLSDLAFFTAFSICSKE